MRRSVPLLRLCLWLCALSGAALAFEHPLVVVPKTVFDYCKLTCKNSSEKNIACRYKECAKHQNVHEVPWDFSERRKTLEHFNEKRNQLANGPANTSTFGYSWGTNSSNWWRVYKKASSMQMLNYDIELEFLMACFLMTGSDSQSQCWRSQRFPTARPIEKYVYDVNLKTPSEVLNSIIDSIYLDYKYPNDSTYLKYPGKGLSDYKDDFLQFGWSRSTHIGCYLVATGDIRLNRGRAGCMMAPAGLVVGEPVYEQGDEMKCPAGTKPNSNPKYNRLCGEKEAWQRGSAYVGNIIIEERHSYWHPRKPRVIKNGEDDMSATTRLRTSTTTGAIPLTISIFILLFMSI